MSDKKLEIFLEHKSSLMALSYRMLGTVSEAEEIVQEVFIKWQQIDEEIKTPKAWLIRICSNLSIDALRKAYKKREEYKGPWLPEPVINDFDHWQEDKLELSESLTMAFLLVLENLKPVERAVFLLKEVFSYPYADIAVIVERSEANCRKIFQRAKEYMATNKSSFDNPSDKDLDIIFKFFEGAKSGKNDEIRDLFSENPEFWSDGGGKVAAAPKVLRDAQKIARFFVGILKAKDESKAKFEVTRINNRHGLIFSMKGDDGLWNLETIMSFEISEGKISRIFAVRNPDKIDINRYS